MFDKMKNIITQRITAYNEYHYLKTYYNRYKNSSFVDLFCSSKEQYEASITRLYHTIEKGLSYTEYRSGFGKDNIRMLIESMEQYSKKYSTSEFFYQTALSVLHQYILKNEQYGDIDQSLANRVAALPGTDNGFGGVTEFDVQDVSTMNYEEMVKRRHSIRHFSSEPLSVEKVLQAIELAQYTPSACNRQGWKCYLIQEKKIMDELLKNQNGNRGFGHEFDKLLLVTGDLRNFNRNREVFQVFIDGGMYAMRLLDSLYYHGIAACPLSASLSPDQERNARSVLNLNDAEVFILYIGIGNYPAEKCQTAKSARHLPRVKII